MQDNRTDETSTDDGHTGCQVAKVLLEVTYRIAHDIEVKKHDEHSLTEGSNKDMNQNDTPSRCSLLIKFHHLGLPFDLLPLVLVNSIVLVKILSSVVVIVSLELWQGKPTFWCLKRHEARFGPSSLFLQKHFVDILILGKTGKTQGVNVFIKAQMCANTDLTVTVASRSVRVVQIRVILVNERVFLSFRAWWRRRRVWHQIGVHRGRVVRESCISIKLALVCGELEVWPANHRLLACTIA